MDQTRRVIADGGIAVVNGRIVAIGPRAEIESRYTSRQRINATGKVITPGLINGHTHVPMVLFRGLADDLDLQEWLTKYIFPAEAKNVTEEFVRVGTRLGLAEMIRGGTTTYCDMYYFEDAIADETAKAGVRGVCREVCHPLEGSRTDRSRDCAPRALHSFRRASQSGARVFRSHWRAHRYTHFRDEA
jgi:5-methylthioadenosine/S-adenosylhomocysteine deaminase